MSCRVLGRRVEQATLDVLARLARARGCKRLVGEYRPTAKNAMVAGLYADLGFAGRSEEGGAQFFAPGPLRLPAPGRPSRSKSISKRCKDAKMMSREQIVSQAQAIFREVLDSPNLVLTDDLTAAKVKGWDSLNHMTLVMTLEEHFKVKFATWEVMSWRNVGEMLDCLDAKLNK